MPAATSKTTFDRGSIMEIISRKQSQSENLPRYFTGKPCKYNHVSERYTANGTCVVCAELRRLRPDVVALEMSYRQSNAEKARERAAQWYADNQDRVKEYRRVNKDRILQYKRETWHRYRDGVKEKRKAYREANKRRRNDYERARYHSDPLVKCDRTCRYMVSRVMSKIGSIKCDSTFDILGYSASDLMRHLESKFTDGMTWDNRSEWHVDHVIPIKWFLDNGITDVSVINHLSNLQPLWASDNLSKSWKVPDVLKGR